MWNFWKQHQDAEQQRRIERVLDAQKQFLSLYEQLDKPKSQTDEQVAVKAFFEEGCGQFLR